MQHLQPYPLTYRKTSNNFSKTLAGKLSALQLGQHWGALAEVRPNNSFKPTLLRKAA